MMMEPRKSFLLRVNGALWREIEAWAQEDFRSVNGQIEYLLRDAVRRRRGEEEAPPVKEAPSTQEASERREPPYPSGSIEVGRHD